MSTQLAFHPARQRPAIRGSITKLMVAAVLVTAAWQSLSAGQCASRNRRGSVAFFTGGAGQLIEWVGPDSIRLECPAPDPNRPTAVFLRLVPRGMSALRKLPRSVQITHLILEGVPVTAEDVAFLVSRHPGLTTLVLRGSSSMPSDELADLTPNELLDLKVPSLSDRELATLGALTNLRSLQLDACVVPQSHLTFLSRLPALELLAIRNMQVSDTCLDSLRFLRSLAVLDLSGTAIKGPCLCALKNSVGLRQLILNRTQVSDDLSRYVNDSLQPRLENIEIDRCQLTERGKADLQGGASLATISATDGCELASVMPPKDYDAQSTRMYRAACQMLHGSKTIDIRLKDGHAIAVKILPGLDISDNVWSLHYVSLLKGLKVLDISGCRISASVMAEIGRYDELEELNLSKSSVDDFGLRQLRKLKALRGLGLRETKLSDAGLECLVDLASLEKLDIADTQVTDRGVRQISEHLRRLHFLRLNGCRISDGGACELGRMKLIEELGLGDTQVTDRGTVAIAGLPNLRRLDLANCMITDAGAGNLLKVGRLEGLSMEGTSITDSMVAKLQLHVSGVIGKEHPAGDTVSSLLTSPVAGSVLNLPLCEYLDRSSLK